MASFIQTGLKIPRPSADNLLPYFPLPTPYPRHRAFHTHYSICISRALEGKAGKLRALNSGLLLETLKRNAIQTDEEAKTKPATNQNQSSPKVF